MTCNENEHIDCDHAPDMPYSLNGYINLGVKRGYIQYIEAQAEAKGYMKGLMAASNLAYKYNCSMDCGKNIVVDIDALLASTPKIV
jgi:hypothetical protein